MFCLFFTRRSSDRPSQRQTQRLGKFARYFLGCLERGVYFAPSQFESGFLSVAHDAADLETTARVVRESLRAIG